MAEETAVAEQPRRASGWLACGVVVGIAVLAAGGVVSCARLGGAATPGAPSPLLVEESVPETLAGGIELGEVPPAVAGAFDGPVVAARFLDEVPAGADCGWVRHDLGDDAEVESVLATPNNVQVTMLGIASFEPVEQAQRMRATCSVNWEHGGWGGSGGSMGPADDPMAGGMSGSSCCDQDGFGTAEATVVAPQGARWVVQDRGGYHLAYPVTPSGAVPIFWRFPGMQRGFFAGRFAGEMLPGASTVVFVAEDGEVIGEVTVRG